MENMVKGVCVDYTYDGMGIIKIDGEVLFAKNLIIGEEAKVRVLKKEKNYYVGEVIKIYNPSSNRVTPSCPYFDDCGGCHLLHMNYEEQAKFKEKHVQNCINRLGGIDKEVLPIIKMEKPYKVQIFQNCLFLQFCAKTQVTNIQT